jgi:glutamate N-acetyltransferase/amino-acid N-acetyltransferase
MLRQGRGGERVNAPKGFLFGAAEGAVKAPGRLDMGLIFCEGEGTAAGVFTRNRVVAAPVTLSRERIRAGKARAVLVNSGNANACTGEKGLADARRLTARAAAELGIDPMEVLVCSTGVIGLPLPVERMEAALPALRQSLGPDLAPFSRSILTTDVGPKVASRVVEAQGGPITVAGAAKGAGMIRPDMATMLAFLVTDAKIGAPALQETLGRAAARTFNRITVDGDTSTNDTLLLLAGGRSGAPAVESDPDLTRRFAEAVEGVCRDLARMIAADGEGATKLVDVTVSGAATEEEAEAIAFVIAESPLVKTALHGEDPNWGRIAGALGRSGHYRGGPFHIAVGGVWIVRDGLGLGAAAEKEAHARMKEHEFEVRVEIAQGAASATVTTCDFSAEYVRINADYRS